jgi:phage terminase small subunit
MPQELTNRQQTFVVCYLKHENGQKAAIEAGYARKSAGVEANRLLKHPKIRSEIIAAKKRVAERTEIDAAWLLNRLAELAEVDVLDLFDEGGDLRPLDDIPPRARRLISSIEVKALYAGSGQDRVQVGHVSKLKLLDRVKVLELIGRHIDIGAWQADTPAVLPFVIFRNFTGMGPEEVEGRLTRLLADRSIADGEGDTEEEPGAPLR